MGLRILHCVSSVNPVGGGVIEAVRQLSAINIRDGHTVEVLSLDDPASPWVRECPLVCHAMGPVSLGTFAYSKRYVPWLRANRSRYDAVVINGLWQYHSFGAWRALQGTDTPYLVFSHGMLDPWFKRHYPRKHLKKWLYWPWSEYRVLRDAAAVLFTCEEERRLARESFWLYRCNEAVVNFGTGRPPSDVAAQRSAFQQRFPELVGKRCLLFLGRVHEKKAPDLLFAAFRNILDRLPAADTAPLHIVMAGPADHPYGEAMKAMVVQLGLATRVTWTGMLTGNEKWGAFRCADAFVLPSHQENFGIAVTEALACSLPVLISNQVNIWREIQRAGAGFVDSDTLDGTKRLLERWIGTNAVQRQDMRASARSCFDDHFDIEHSGMTFIDAIRTHGSKPA